MAASGNPAPDVLASFSSPFQMLTSFQDRSAETSDYVVTIEQPSDWDAKYLWNISKDSQITTGIESNEMKKQESTESE
jgi:hypothetical protein